MTLDARKVLSIEKSLKHEQDFISRVLSTVSDLVIVLDNEGRIIRFNRACETITGYSFEEVRGKPFWDLFSPPEEIRGVKDTFTGLKSGRFPDEYENYWVAKNGDRRLIHLSYSMMTGSDGMPGYVIGTGRNIIEHRQAEEAPPKSEEEYRHLITYANAPIIVWDPQFRITLFNRAFEHLTGRKAQEVIGQNFEILLPENYRTVTMDLIRKTPEGERWDSVEVPILHKDGGVRTVLWNTASIVGPDGKTIVSTIAQGQDITERKKIESEYRLQASEYAKMNVALKEEIRQRGLSDVTLKKTLSLLNASLESTADGLLVIDRNGKITSYNQNFMNMWNIPRDRMESMESLAVMKEIQPQLKDPGGFLASIRELSQHPERQSYDMIELKDERIFERYSNPQKIGDRVVGRVWSYRDITDRRRAESKLVTSLQEKEVLLREIHHRVKNNLQLISGLLDMTRMRTADESTNSILTDMMLKIQTMAQIHTRLYESKQFGKISLTGQIHDQVAALSNIYSHKGHEIVCEINSGEVFLPVDQAIPCALVVNEVLSNAFKHAFKGREHGTIEISAFQENGRIRIAIRDNGVGIPATFDISQARSLGLKLIRTLIQHQLNGSITIKRENGTEMIVEFPVITVEA